MAPEFLSAGCCSSAWIQQSTDGTPGGALGLRSFIVERRTYVQSSYSRAAQNSSLLSATLALRSTALLSYPNRPRFKRGKRRRLIGDG